MDTLDTYAEVVHGDCNQTESADIEDFENNEDDYMDVDGDGSRNKPKRAVVSKSHAASAAVADPADWIIDIREYDVPYYLRVSIDRGASPS